jgi:hypothetical protein
MKTFADKVIQFNKSLRFDGVLPEGIRIMNPFREDKAVQGVAAAFYKKYYDDHNPRHIILGINPGRFGGGITGVPFTDPKRLAEKCGIPFHGPPAHEPSSVFIYEMIDAFGGPAAFYGKIYINSICPLGFTSQKPGGKEVNYNYYDSKELTAAVYDFMNESIRKQLALWHQHASSLSVSARGRMKSSCRRSTRNINISAASWRSNTRALSFNTNRSRNLFISRSTCRLLSRPYNKKVHLLNR